MSQKKERIFGLDVMRAIAISMVLVSHTLYVFPGYKNPLTDIMHLMGIQGVEVFFVLSGFLIGNILLRVQEDSGFTWASIKTFWIRRWFRTLPLYYLMLIVNIIIAYSIGYHITNEHKLWQFFLFLQNFATEHILFFPESWSLSVEEYAYIVGPLVLTTSFYIFRKKRWAFLVGTLSILLFFFCTKHYFYWNHRHVLNSLEFWNLNIKAVVVYRIDAIYYGFLLAYWCKVCPRTFKQFRYILLVLGLIMVGVLYIVIPIIFKIQYETHPWYWNVLYLPLNSLTIALFVPFLYYLKTPVSWIKEGVYKLSIYSYAMYLLHYTFVLYLMRMVYNFDQLVFAQRIGYALLYLVITYFLSSILYKYYEKPMMSLRDRPLFKKKA